MKKGPFLRILRNKKVHILEFLRKTIRKIHIWEILLYKNSP